MFGPQEDPIEASIPDEGRENNHRRYLEYRQAMQKEKDFSAWIRSKLTPDDNGWEGQ